MLMPEIIKLPEHLKANYLAELDRFRRVSPSDYFAGCNQYPQFAPRLSEEARVDLQDVIEFYKKSFVELRNALRKKR
jgi:hypothetical protein